LLTELLAENQRLQGSLTAPLLSLFVIPAAYVLMRQPR